VRADPRIVPLVEKQGLMEYWRATKTRPDACETEDVPFCRELKAAKPQVLWRLVTVRLGPRVLPEQRKVTDGKVDQLLPVVLPLRTRRFFAQFQTRFAPVDAACEQGSGRWRLTAATTAIPSTPE